MASFPACACVCLQQTWTAATGRCCSLQRVVPLLILLRATTQCAVWQFSHPGAVVCVTLLQMRRGVILRTQRIADQHGNMIQVCLLLLGTAFWGGDRIGTSDPRFVVVGERKARKAQRLRILQVPTLWPPCRVTAGV
jgi:hypothetical protein